MKVTIAFRCVWLARAIRAFKLQTRTGQDETRYWLAVAERSEYGTVHSVLALLEACEPTPAAAEWHRPIALLEAPKS